MSLISDEKSRSNNNDLCRSAELDKLESEWSNLNWNKITRNIHKIQQRIFHAEDQNNYRRVRSLIKTIIEHIIMNYCIVYV